MNKRETEGTFPRSPLLAFYYYTLLSARSHMLMLIR